MVSQEVLNQYQDIMAGLNANNVLEVHALLGELRAGAEQLVHLTTPQP